MTGGIAGTAARFDRSREWFPPGGRLLEPGCGAGEAGRALIEPAGVLLSRVNATADVHFGALEGDEIERRCRTSEHSAC